MIITEKKLIMACLAFSVIGIAILFMAGSVTEPPLISVTEALGSTENVKISGILMSYEPKGSHVAMKIAGSEEIGAVSFETDKISRLGLQKFQEVEITGQVRQYKGSKSLIISKIRKLGSICNSTSQKEAAE